MIATLFTLEGKRVEAVLEEKITKEMRRIAVDSLKANGEL